MLCVLKNAVNTLPAGGSIFPLSLMWVDTLLVNISELLLEGTGDILILERGDNEMETLHNYELLNTVTNILYSRMVRACILM